MTLTVAGYAASKGFPVAFLTGLGLRDVTAEEAQALLCWDRPVSGPAVAMPYHRPDGLVAFTRCRLSMTTRPFQPRGVSPDLPGGLAWLQGKRDLLVVEGESCLHAARLHGLDVLASPGVGAWKRHAQSWRAYVEGYERCFVYFEGPDAEFAYPDFQPDEGNPNAAHGFRKAVALSHPNVLSIRVPAIKDVSDLHLADAEGFKARMVEAARTAIKIEPDPEPEPTRIRPQPQHFPRGEWDILMFVTPYVHDLRERGPGKWIGRCPFHDDNRPSLRIDRQKNVWYCDPCSAGGGVRSFLEAIAQRSGRDWVDELRTAQAMFANGVTV